MTPTYRKVGGLHFLSWGRLTVSISWSRKSPLRRFSDKQDRKLGRWRSREQAKYDRRTLVWAVGEAKHWRELSEAKDKLIAHLNAELMAQVEFDDEPASYADEHNVPPSGALSHEELYGQR
jgi:hypothetical protein